MGENDEAGRQCPLRYRYGPKAIAAVAAQPCDTLWVVGGLYGNPQALDAVLALVRQEQARTRARVRLCFNGDFNWFNITPSAFERINTTVLEHDVVLGNVEAELGEPLDTPDCGCAYPEHVDAGVVARSNSIHTRLKQVAQAQPAVLARLQASPMFARYEVGGLQLGVVHGDSESLAGWQFDPACIALPGHAQWRTAQFEQAAVDAFASTHTCTAVLHTDTLPSGQRKVISNNGAAGMPSVPGALAGLVTRVSVTPCTQAPVHASVCVQGVWVEQVQLNYDHSAWLAQFHQWWPPGSPAFVSYAERIAHGVSRKP